MPIKATADPYEEQYPETGSRHEYPPAYAPTYAPTMLNNPEHFEDPNHPARWKHRRRMAYTALFSMLVVTAHAMGPWLSLERLDKLQDVISWFYFAMASIVGAYMGFATWSARTGR